MYKTSKSSRQTSKEVPVSRFKAALTAWAMSIALVASVLVVTTAADVAQAPPAFANASGACSGPRSTFAKDWKQLYANWKAEGVLGQVKRVAARNHGFSPQDETFKHWLSTRTVPAKLVKATWVNNFSCRGGKMRQTTKRLLPKGATVHIVLPAKYAKSDVRTSPGKGFKKVVFCAKFLAQAS